MVSKTSRTIKKIEYIFEAFIWNFRFFILAPVIFSLLSALRLIIIGTLDILAGLFFEFRSKKSRRRKNYKNSFLYYLVV